MLAEIHGLWEHCSVLVLFKIIILQLELLIQTALAPAVRKKTIRI
jgi:hypothetical protein